LKYTRGSERNAATPSFRVEWTSAVFKYWLDILRLKMFWSSFVSSWALYQPWGDAADSETDGKMYLTSGRFKWNSCSHPILHCTVWIALHVAGSLIVVRAPITSHSAEWWRSQPRDCVFMPDKLSSCCFSRLRCLKE